MSAPTCARVLRQAASRSSRQWMTAARPLSQPASRTTARLAVITPSKPRCFSVAARSRAGMMPDTSDPQPPKSVEEDSAVLQPTEIDEDEYHDRAEEYMEAVHEKAEAMQEAREDVDVEYSAGVLSLTVPPAGTYVINKQPPNKQIWLSSPVSGPKRFDWVVHGESMHQKEGGGVGDWVYLRDGTSLTDLLRSELGIVVDLHGHEESMQQSLDPTE